MHNQIINDDTAIIQLKDKVVSLKIKDFAGNEIDVEELLQVDYNNIIGDIITFPVIFNRLCNIKAQMDNMLREAEFDCKAFEAQLYMDHKSKMLLAGKTTEAAIDMAVKRDPKYKVKKFELFNIQKQADIIDGLYWSAKSKGRMLEAISNKISPDEFERDILESTINSVQIKIHKNYFQNKH